jgi:hypothetical protein
MDVQVCGMGCNGKTFRKSIPENNIGSIGEDVSVDVRIPKETRAVRDASWGMRRGGREGKVLVLKRRKVKKDKEIRRANKRRI